MMFDCFPFSHFKKKPKTEIIEMDTKVQTISTLHLIYLLKKVPSSKDKDNLLDMVPFSSNYLIDNYIDNNGNIHGNIYMINKDETYRPSNTSIKRHINVSNLTHQCKIGLTAYQIQLLRNLIEK